MGVTLSALSSAIVHAGTLPITPETLNLIAEADELKDAWQALGVHVRK
jgi:hypothetical protein